MTTLLSAALVSLLATASPGAHASASATHAAAATPMVVPFVDDYDRALAEAKRRNVPIFVDAWAPWCHTCRSMRAFVFTDPALARHRDEYVWLEVDTENAKNAALSKRLGIVALPTFFVLNSENELVALRWVGGATVPQMLNILADGRAAGGTAHVASLTPSVDADHAFANAEESYGAADYKGAAAEYGAALVAAPANWGHYSRAVESRLFALGQIDDNAATAALAKDAYPRLRRTPSAANVAASGLDAALSLPASDAARAELVKTLEADGREVVGDLTVPVAADDRSSLYGSLVDARDDAGDSTGSRQTAEAWSAFLDAEAAKAKTPDARAVYDSHRLFAYLALGQPERAVPMLQASEKALPDDYNPPARLAAAYKAMKRWDDALAASDRALAKAYGPRKLGILQTRADIYAGRGDAAAQKRTLNDALATAEAFPDGQRSDRTIAALKKKLEALN